MRQLFSKVIYNVGFGGNVCFIDILGGAGDATFIESSGNFYAIPVAVAGTFRNLVVRSQTTHPDATVTLMHGIDVQRAVPSMTASALSVFLGSGDVEVSDTSDELTVVAGEYVALRMQMAGAGAGFIMGFSVEFEAAEQTYGIRTTEGHISGQRQGGSLGNGGFTEVLGPPPANDSNTYSVNAVPGVIKRLVLGAELPVTIGDVTGYIRLNGTIQDGSGGTVNTTCVVAGPLGIYTSVFDLPIAVTDHVETVLFKNGGAEFISVTTSIGFLPDDGASFMLCGGSNQVLGTYAWTLTEQSTMDVNEAVAPVGPRGLVALGLYGQMGAGGTSGIFQVSLFKDEVITAITFGINVAGNNRDGFILATVPFAAGSTMTLNLPTGSFGQLHWGLAAVFPDEPSGGGIVVPSPACPPGFLPTAVSGGSGCPTGLFP